MSEQGPAVRLHPNRAVRIALIVAGTVLAGLGILGIFVPLLPSLIFLIGAAACYARASERFYRRLLDSRLGGPIIREWREHHTISPRAKRAALFAIVLTFLTTTVFFVPGRILRIVVLLIGVGVFTIVARLPVRQVTGRRPEGRRPS